MKRIAALTLALLCLLPMQAKAAAPMGLTVPTAILLEKTTGTIL